MSAFNPLDPLQTLGAWRHIIDSAISSFTAGWTQAFNC